VETTEPPKPSFKLPNSLELYDFFNTFIQKWLKLAASRVEHADDDIQTLPNEHGLLFQEPLTGILVIRTSEDFGKGLARLAQTKEIDHDLFVEMIVLFWHRFVSTYWGKDSRLLPPALFKKSVPKHWPDRKPDSHLLVFVIQQPVEVRIWTHLTEAEIERWKTKGK